MSQITQNLRRWAEALDSGEYEQHFGDFFGPETNHVCAGGCWMAVRGFNRDSDFSERGRVLDEVDWTGRTQDLVACEIERITGKRLNEFQRWIPLLNDDHKIPFPTFARAIRTVARQMEEAEYGAPIAAPVAEEALVLR